MIEKVLFGNLSKSREFGYAANLPFFKGSGEVRFSTGLNIMFTPNGSGKSTILSMIALSTASQQGGISTLTHTWANQINDRITYDKKTPLGDIQVIHDGQPVVYGNPREGVGYICNGAGWDDDFFSEGIEDFKLQESTGLTSLYRLRKAMDYIDGKMPIPNEYQRHKHFGDKELPQILAELIEGKIPKGQKTILLDEPESGVAINTQADMWRRINKSAKEQDLQIIIATHSVFALACDANFIELTPDYVSSAKQSVLDLIGKFS